LKSIFYLKESKAQECHSNMITKITNQNKGK